jgi:DNA polymerase-3 subunit delta
MPVLVLAGDEDFEISRKVKELKAKLLDPSWASVNFQRLDNPSLQEISDAAQTIPFGPGNRVVLIDRCELFTKKRAKAGAASAAKASAKSAAKAAKDKDAIEPEDFEKSLSGVHPNTHLIFSCPFNFDSTLKISKAVSKVATVEAFPKEKYWPGSHNAKLHSWCQKEAKQYSATIDDEAIQYLLDSTEANLRQVSSELAKAAVAALPATHINYALIVELSPHHSNVFELADKWISGDTADALVSLHELLREQSGIPVLATLQTLLGKWIRMKVICDKINSELPGGAGVKRKELPLPELTRRVASELKLVPFVVERDLRKIARIPTTQLLSKRDELTRLEHLLKTGQVPERHALELFAVTSPHRAN